MTDPSHDRRTGPSEVVLYRTADGRSHIQVRLENDTAWLTQAWMAELFRTTPQSTTMHIESIYDDGELAEEATCKESLQVRQEAGTCNVG